MSSLKLQSLAHAEGDPDIPKAAYAEHRALHTCGLFRLFSAGCAPEGSKIRRHLDPILHISDLWTYSILQNIDIFRNARIRHPPRGVKTQTSAHMNQIKRVVGQSSGFFTL